MIKNSKYFKILNKPKNKKLRLFCFPYAGGAAAIYNTFVDNIGDDIELVAIQLPGRAELMFDELIKDMDKLINILYKHMSLSINEPYAFFGYSMGGAIAYALTKKIEESSSNNPKFTIISATKPPFMYNEYSNHTLSDEGLTDILRKHSASPKEVLDSKDMMELLLPGIRADYQLIETYKIQRSPNISTQVILFNSEEDLEKEVMLTWKDYLKIEPKYIEFEGGHFFIHSQLNMLIQEIKNLIN